MVTAKKTLAHRFHSAQVIQLAELLIKRADQYMSKTWSLSFAQFKVLAILSECDDSSQRMIADCLELTPAAISRLTESLVTKKLIERQPKADNRRQNVLTITLAGRQVLDQSIMMIEQLENRLYGNLKQSELNTFKKVLTTLLDKISS
jgi:DNA-binding MarR family transcriptional regulator